MRLTIDLPATLDELEHFVSILRSLGLEGHYPPVIAGDDQDGYELLGEIGVNP